MRNHLQNLINTLETDDLIIIGMLDDVMNGYGGSVEQFREDLATAIENRDEVRDYANRFAANLGTDTE